MALLRDARFCKARYRRALARQRQGRLMEALVDLASVLTADPMDRTAAAAFETIQRELERSGFERNFLSPMSILQADYPSAYGSAAAAPRPVRNESPDDAIVVQNSSHPIPKDLRAGTCASCKTVKWKREIKTCRGVSAQRRPYLVQTFLISSFIDPVRHCRLLRRGMSAEPLVSQVPCLSRFAPYSAW
jgi:hypothetical protein